MHIFSLTTGRHWLAHAWTGEATALDGPVTTGSLVETWNRRIHYREELARLSKDGPELLDDIGLTTRQVEDELTKPFWRE
ncbi:DUF1127 domain-containing protein [Sinorhizobium americanum]|uniref:DUF1127 domain-containing protein n=1 Tax=Sinorhizobium americanum TaxID=194963 RepID=A0A4R2BP71_9HYPH|nr:hypothetical protein [Sinorhizobium americanum]TCN29076.1 hypothetical protein EV184_111178 [Sinorhizobium americanum]